MDKSNSENQKFNYSLDKSRWLVKKSGEKIKLRAYIAELSKIVAKETGNRISTERRFIIKAYNAGGLNGVKLWIIKCLEK